MALFPAHLPFLYCMFYYRTGRQSSGYPRQVVPLADHQESNFHPSGHTQSDRSWMYRHHHLQRQRERSKICSDFNNLNLDSLRSRNSGGEYNDHNVKKEKKDGNVDDGDAMCSLKDPNDVRRLLPERFQSEEDLVTFLPRLQASTETSQSSSRLSAIRRYVMRSGRHVPSKTGNYRSPGGGRCEPCSTEVGYEVLTEVTSFQGERYSVLNFNNSYQFIPAGRCVNENSPCGTNGNSRCRQVFRAHWTLVWAQNSGAHLVAHEVPSHCECTNIGSAPATDTPTMKVVKLESSTHEGDQGLPFDFSHE